MNLLLLTLSLAWASPKSDITTGTMACDNDQPAEAVERLRAGMAQADALKDKDIAKGGYNLGRCAIRLIIEGDADPELAFSAADGLIAARAADAKGRYAERIAAEWETLYRILYNLGAVASDPAASAELQANGQRAIDKLLAWDAEDHTAHMLRAHSALMAKDFPAMAEAALGAIAAYEASPPDAPDLNISLAGQMAANALGLLAEEPQPSEALDALARTRALLESMEGQVDDRELAVELENIRRSELNLYIQHRELHDEAIARFEEAVADNPDDSSIKLGLAVVIEPKDPMRARALYEEVTAADPDNLEAWFNLGASYLNESLELNKQMMDALEPKPELEAQDDALSEKARAAMENAHRLDPKNVEVLRQLERLAIEADDTEAYEAYKAKRKELLGE